MDMTIQSAVNSERRISLSSQPRAVATLLRRIQSEYREMPGLCLHMNQAARLFGLRAQTCQIVLEDLVHKGRLRRALDGQYVSGELDTPIVTTIVAVPRAKKLPA